MCSFPSPISTFCDWERQEKVRTSLTHADARKLSLRKVVTWTSHAGWRRPLPKEGKPGRRSALSARLIAVWINCRVDRPVQASSPGPRPLVCLS